MRRSPYKPESGIRSFLMMPTEDFDEFDILPYLLEAIAFLSRAESSGGCAFVHCNYGVNRSGVVAAAYLMVAEHKPLLRVINELKAKRSLILSNVGFRRQLVRFARCRGLLDPVERPSRRSPRLEPGEGTPRGATPSKDASTEETKEESGDPESGEAKETSGMNGDPPPRNGYHVIPPALTEPKPNGVPTSNGALRPRPNNSRRERLLRDVDLTIETLSVRDDADLSSYYRPTDSVDFPVSSSVYEQPRSFAYLPDHTSDLPVPRFPLFEVLGRAHSSDSDDDFSTSSGDRSISYYSPARPSNAVLDEYLQYKRSSAPFQTAYASPPLSEPTVKPRLYRPSVTASSVIEDYDEANMSSFLAERNARRTLAHRRLDQAIAGLDPRRRSASSVDALLGTSRSSLLYSFFHRRRRWGRQGARAATLPPPNRKKNIFFGSLSCKIRKFRKFFGQIS